VHARVCACARVCVYACVRARECVGVCMCVIYILFCRLLQLNILVEISFQ